ncbi:MAG: phage holin family protein [Gammaproteobacteria bacterium]|nr:phage holin family protein [Gammaproteobacteria bacterium]
MKSERESDSPEAPAAGGIFAAITNAISSARDVLTNFVELATLELRQAGHTLMWLVAIGIVVGFAIIGTWTALMVMLALWMVSLGVSWLAAFAGVASLNLLLAIGGVLVAFKLSRNLLFPATRRQLRKTPADSP